MGATQPAAGTAQGGGGNASFSILLMIGMFAVLYFLMITRGTHRRALRRFSAPG